LRKPCCSSERRLVFSRWVRTLQWIMCSMILQHIDVNDIGL
jgi:hypothetical protein